MNDFNWAEWGLLMFMSVCLIFIFALLIMWLWNIVMPVFGLPELTYWQAVVLKVLFNLLSTHNFSLINNKR